MLGRVSRLLRGSLRAVGFDLKRFGPLVDPHLRRQQVLASHGIDLVLDGGANRGQYAGRLREYGYRGAIHSLEPGCAAFAQLEEACRHDPHWSCTRAALGEHPGTAQLHVTTNSVSSSLHETLPAMAIIPGTRVEGHEQVDVTTVARVLADADRGAASVLLKLDVQGAEQAALEGAGPALDRIRLIELELAFEPLHVGQPSASELTAWLEARGFRQVGVAANTIDPATGHLLEVDALFARTS